MTAVGRYAPSPTGLLHLGNLRTALAAAASARSRGGRLLLRIEDLDRDRCRATFEERQLADLALLGFVWDAPPLRQSERTAVYARHFETLRRKRLVYPCFCSRKDIAAAASAPHGPGGVAYPGTCRGLAPSEAETRIARGDRHAWRVRVDLAAPTFLDGFKGEVPLDLKTEGGDFVVRRADGFYAYQFACAVDDALCDVTEVVRGADLLDSGARQAYLLELLELPIPRYVHLPLMLGEDGRRLAKREGSDDLASYLARGYEPPAIIGYLAHTLGLADRGERPTLAEVARRWDPALVPREEVFFSEQTLAAFRPRH